MAIPSDAVSNERSVAGGSDARETFVHDGDHMITALSTWLDRQDRRR
jgi:hypothetical protein